MSKVLLTTTLCLMLGQHLILWINMNPVLGHRSYWCAVSVSRPYDTLAQYWFNVGPSFMMQAQHLRKHWACVDLSCLRCRIDNAGLIYANCL